ncbi:MAG: hypothetical protein GY788_06250 [bacterium]|nr:hypothetical protein [bacterium]
MTTSPMVRSAVDRLTDDDKLRARSVLALHDDASDAQIASVLEPFARAAFAEYVAQLVGHTLPSRFKDQQMHRLLQICLHANAGKLLDPDRVADLFHITYTEAKTLVRNTATRYRFEFESVLREVGWQLLVSTAERDGDAFQVEIRDSALLEHFNDLVRRAKGRYPTGIQATGEMHVFSLDLETMECLTQGLGYDLPALENELA